MEDISKAIVDGSLEAISEDTRNKLDGLNRHQRRAMEKLQRKSDALDAKIDKLSRHLPTKL